MIFLRLIEVGLKLVTLDEFLKSEIKYSPQIKSLTAPTNRFEHPI